MPRDELVGSFGRLALKPTEFRKQVGLIGFPDFHDLPPCFDDSGIASDSLAKQTPDSGAGEDRNGTLFEVSGSSLAADGPAERVAKDASGVLRPRQCRRGNFGEGRRQ
jgi:hypothetical protein